MKKLLLLILFFVLIANSAAFSHNPWKIKAEYDAETDKVEATIVHPVKNPKVHYIERIDIWLNGQKVGVLEFEEQKDKRFRKIEYQVKEARRGDMISIEAFCSRKGSMMTNVTVE